MVRTVQKLMAPLQRRLLLMIGRGVLRLVDDARKMQTLQVAGLAGEVRDGVEHFQPYGFTAHPLSGAEALYVRLGGSSAHTVVLAVADRRYRITALEAGEVALHDDQGQKVHLQRNKTMEISGCDTLNAIVGVKMCLQSPLLEVTGNITCSNLIAANDVKDQNGAKSMAGMRAVHNIHNHGAGAPPNQQM